MVAQHLDATRYAYAYKLTGKAGLMFLDPSHYPYLKHIIENADIISEELKAALQNNAQVKKGLFTNMEMDYPSNQWTWDNAINSAAIGYDLREGSYTMLSLYKTGHNLEIAQEAFPKTLKLLEDVVGIEYACISALSPGAHLALHTHNRQRYIFHLLLNNLKGGHTEIICNGKHHEMKLAGDTVIFDYSLPHESSNCAENIRFNLMVDFFPTNTYC